MTYYNIHTHRDTIQYNVFAIANIDIHAHFAPLEGAAYSAGIHPWQANIALLAKLQQIAAHSQIIAIGETGLDKVCETDFTIQKEIFEAQIQLAEDVHKPLIIHCVKAWDELMYAKKKLRPSMPWIIHGFRGKAALADQLIEAGMYLSFGKLYNTEAVKAAWEKRRLLAETDDSIINIREVYQKISNDLKISETVLQNEIKKIINAQIINKQCLA